MREKPDLTEEAGRPGAMGRGEEPLDWAPAEGGTGGPAGVQVGEAVTMRPRATPCESQSLVVSLGERRQRCLRFLDPGLVQTPPESRDREGIQMSLRVGLPHQH